MNAQINREQKTDTTIANEIYSARGEDEECARSNDDGDGAGGDEGERKVERDGEGVRLFKLWPERATMGAGRERELFLVRKKKMQL
jgi:hypothetical protein